LQKLDLSFEGPSMPTNSQVKTSLLSLQFGFQNRHHEIQNIGSKSSTEKKHIKKKHNKTSNEHSDQYLAVLSSPESQMAFLCPDLTPSLCHSEYSED
jgi:hypothetical protein